ncbi:preprotein translocase subunit SecE [Posidoniimonas corsicana]|uniref:Protein translocase subunit SecE n=1 Tax=Posidoniimonas corsicana TaxID=1938618 RepID=A0A5C5VGN0_9BACT|nr:preprotein translocase subunit SecE [Posidoniimonas corsicana]TWT36792.1 preprotein translocase subunit SecE [Posidoniimonas corsicana]
MTAYLHQLFSFGFYKRTQGKVARQTTFYAIAVAVAIGAYSLMNWMQANGSDNAEKLAVPVSVTLFALGVWAAFRLIQLPSFADFLISVEAEMNKVTWPKRGELWRASVVVILTIFVLAALLYLYDLVWRNLLDLLLSIGG